MSANGLVRRLTALEDRCRPVIVQAAEDELLEPARQVARRLGISEEALVHCVRCMALSINADRAAGFTESQIASSMRLTWRGIRTGVSLETAVSLAAEMAEQLASR